MSRCLSDYSIDHVILERGEVANSWKHERWDSLRLLTPNWQSRLPGYSYAGDDPDGYMTMPETIDFIEHYANRISAPVKTYTTVEAVRTYENGDSSGYKITTDRGDWESDVLVVASGACNIANVPAMASAIPQSVSMITPMQYRNPGQLEEGGVLVVGASATGIQLAEEIHRSGRPVTLALGEHVRLPRVYRGKDIQWWMDAVGILNERYDEIDDLVRGRNIPSPQLVGSPERVSLDLNVLTGMGVRLRGKLAGVRDNMLQFSGSLRNNCALADLKMGRLLDTIDEWVLENGLDSEVDPPQRFPPTHVEDSPPLVLDMITERINTILWATGYSPDYSWLDIPVLDRKGKIRHDGGVVTESPGMYLMGMTLLRRRKSSFIHGAGDDARDLSAHIASYLG
jgi:putative flavoprotein involved in K+ transport